MASVLPVPAIPSIIKNLEELLLMKLLMILESVLIVPIILSISLNFLKNNSHKDHLFLFQSEDKDSLEIYFTIIE